jgi:hypothetical protein
MSSRMTLRPRSAAARADRFSFFGEVTQEQMSEYRPDQVQTILRQREGVSSILQITYLNHYYLVNFYHPSMLTRHHRFNLPFLEKQRVRR